MDNLKNINTNSKTQDDSGQFIVTLFRFCLLRKVFILKSFDPGLAYKFKLLKFKNFKEL